MQVVDFFAFQFLMVRLKGFTVSGRKPHPAFQFLMVRLKVLRFHSFARLPAFQFLMVRLKAVCTGFERTKIRFQFLMVRLKVSTFTGVMPISFISIPYGSIKRFFLLFSLVANNTFQFLMVRLKEGLRLLTRMSSKHFNSLWFD